MVDWIEHRQADTLQDETRDTRWVRASSCEPFKTEAMATLAAGTLVSNDAQEVHGGSKLFSFTGRTDTTTTSVSLSVMEVTDTLVIAAMGWQLTQFDADGNLIATHQGGDASIVDVLEVENLKQYAVHMVAKITRMFPASQRTTAPITEGMLRTSYCLN